MNEKMEWERTNDKIIDPSDLLRRMIRSLKWIVLCGVLFAVLLGIYKYNQYLHPVAEDYVKMAKEVKLTAAEEQAVQNVENVMDEILRLQDYMKQSVYINIDPNRQSTVTMLYEISGMEKADQKQIMESYLSYVNDGGAAQFIQERETVYKDLDIVYLSELFSASKESSTKEQRDELVLEQSDASYFYVRIVSDEMDQAVQLADEMQAALAKYSLTVEEAAGGHQLKLLDQQETESYAQDLADQQHASNTSLSDNRARVEALTANFSDGQNTVYNAYLQEKGLVIKNEEPVTAIQVVIFVIQGIILGAFVYCCAYVLFYLCSGTVKSVRELQKKYIYRVFGTIYTGEKKSSRNESKEQDKLVLGIGFLCEDKAIREICIPIADSFDDTIEKHIQDLQDKLAKRGIQSQFVKNICEQPEKWEEFRQIGYVVPVYDMGHTTHHKINEEMKFYQENHIEVLGIVAVEDQ